MMEVFEKKKQEYLGAISVLVLREGIGHCSLKKMAEAASTSDRMLMHYFKDKNEILTLALEQISQELIDSLKVTASQPIPFKAFVQFIREMTQSETVRPYLDLWFEVIDLASGKKEPYHSISSKIGDAYWHWMLSTYEPRDHEDRESMAALLLTLTEGLVMIDKMGMTSQADQAVAALLKLYGKE